MLPDRVSNPGPLTYESGALPIALRGPAKVHLPRPEQQRNDNTCQVFLVELVKPDITEFQGQGGNSVVIPQIYISSE